MTARIGFDAPEPSIGVLPSGEIFVQALDHTVRSDDGGRTWSSVFDYGYGAGVEDLGSSWDPMLWVDRTTERVYWSHMAPYTVCTAIGWSEDKGETWQRNDNACAIPSVDFQKLGGGPPGPDANPLAGVEHPSVLYVCYNKPTPPMGFFVGASAYAGLHCSMSYDGGITWPVESRVGGCAYVPQAGMGTGLTECAGGAGRPVVGPTGTAYIGIPWSMQGPRLGVSTDSGLTWEIIAGPQHDGGSRSAAPNIAFTPDGSMYIAWGDVDRVTYLARSDDRGATWAGPWRVAPPGIDTNVFHALAVGDDGRVAVAFLGTEGTVDESDAPPTTRWDLYIVVSEDANTDDPTFTSVRATDDPVQVGSICLGGFRCQESRNLLDFIDAATAPDGTFYVAFADGCVDECATKADPAPDDSRARAGTVAWSEGWSLTG